MIYYIDKISFNLKVPKNYINRILPLTKLRSYSARCHLDCAGEKARKFGYRTKIEIEQPEMEVFLILTKYEKFMPGYKISYIEIARDTPYSSKTIAVSSLDFILKYRRVRYATNYKIVDSNYSNKLIISEIRYSGRTGYWSNNSAKLVTYSCNSKKKNIPCIHDEYRFHGAGNIKRKTGLSTLNDVINFDFEQFFVQHEEKYITYESVDFEKLGRWVNNIPPKVSVTETFGKEKKIVCDRAKRAAHLFCRASAAEEEYGYDFETIRTAAGLRIFLKNNSKKIKTKLGRRDRWDNKVLDLTPYRINTFFNPIDLTGGLI